MKRYAAAAAAALLMGGGGGAPPFVSAQVPMNGDSGGAKKMLQAMEIEGIQNNAKDTKLEGMMDRAMHRMAAKERRDMNLALVERGSPFMADGTPIKANENAGEQIIDPRTPKGFGNPFFRALHVEQNIQISNLISAEEQKLLAALMRDGIDVMKEAGKEMQETSGWTPFIAEGSMKTPEVRAPEFMAYLEVSPNRIIRRVCESCDEGFKDIYYKRLTNTYTRHLRTMMKDGPFDALVYKGTTNECWKDFTLHSTYEDALSGANPWEHCHPDPAKFSTGQNIGFPSYSGPNNRHDSNNYNKGNAKQNDYAFYMETPNWIPTAGTYRLDIRGSRDGVDIEQDAIARIDEYFQASQNKVARRVCNDCTGVYQDVFYKRISNTTVTDIGKFLLESFQPEGVEGQEFGKDFKIYSTYADALADQNAWESCEHLPANEYGFPGTCKPKSNEAGLTDQWSRITASGGSLKAGKRDTCLYVEKSEDPPDTEEWMSEDEEMELFFYGPKETEDIPCLPKGNAQPNNLGDPAMAPLPSVAANQKYHSLQWFYNPTDTYEKSRAFCQEKGMDLCPREVVCPNGIGNSPYGGTKVGDQWAPVLDSENMWVQVGDTDTCKTHEELHDSIALWGLYGEHLVPIMGFADSVPCCSVAEELDYDPFAGWYDVRGCGNCNEYCFWMSVDGTSFDPKYEVSVDPWHSPLAYDTSGNLKGYFTCVESGSSASDQSTNTTILIAENGLASFPHRKCAAEGDVATAQRKEEYMGCYRTGYPDTLPELIGSGQRLSFSKCADACRSRSYHYFGRTAEEECWCGGRDEDEQNYERIGVVPHGSPDHCMCDEPSIGDGVMCIYRVMDQFDPKKARQQHPCIYLQAKDQQKMCWIACRDSEQSITHKMLCTMMQTMGMQVLSKKITQHFDSGGEQLHMLGGDFGGGTY